MAQSPEGAMHSREKIRKVLGKRAKRQSPSGRRHGKVLKEEMFRKWVYSLLTSSGGAQSSMSFPAYTR